MISTDSILVKKAFIKNSEIWIKNIPVSCKQYTKINYSDTLGTPGARLNKNDELLCGAKVCRFNYIEELSTVTNIVI